MKVMRIMKNVWQVGGEGLTAPGDAAVYLICMGNRAALIDAGTGSGHGRLVKNIAECLPENVVIDQLFLTHCHYDHTGGAAEVKRHFGCKVIIHENEADYLKRGDSTVTAASWYGVEMAPFSVDATIQKEKETFAVGDGMLTAVFCPGHSPGSVVYFASVDEKLVLFGQDVHGPLHPSLLSDRNAYMKSLRFMRSLDADILCEGHYGIYRGKSAVRRFIGSYLEV
jgi:glyoxylase-like metal-dependent hydrolase (beta-lactamase superfamily II)